MGKRDTRNKPRSMEQVLCHKCGLYNDPVFAFCESCGTRLSKGCNGDITPEVSNKTLDTDVPVNTLDEDELTHFEDDSKVSKKSGAGMLLLALIIFAGAFAYRFNLVGLIGDFIGGDEQENVVVPQVVAETETYDQVETGSDSSADVVNDIAPSDIKVLSSDWDWDSARRTSEGYEVDVILYVENCGLAPVTVMTFTVPAMTQEQKAIGFVAAESKGIMVASVKADKMYHKPKKSNYNIVKVEGSESFGGYKVPCGKFVKRYGQGNNCYDVEISNPNQEVISRGTKLVAVLLIDGKIRESDATGVISEEIGVGVSGYIEKCAFYNPNLFCYEDYGDKFKVYAIDSDRLCR